MNQRIPTQRPPQRPSQRANTPSPISPKYGRAFMVLMVTTVALLLISLIVLGVVLCVGGFESNPPLVEDDADTPTTTQKPKPSTDASQPSSLLKQKTTIKIPSTTATGNYISTSNGFTIDGVKSTYAIVVDLASNQALATKNADVPAYPASLTKVMTLLVACENVKNATDLLTVTQEMVDYHRDTGGSGSLSFVAGESITVEDALHLVNYNSDTVACLLLANYVTGKATIAEGEAAFVELMNQKAKDIGLTGTSFKNCTGLHDPDHFTTARDMAAIMKAALSNSAAKAVLTAYQGYSVSIYQIVNGKASLLRAPTVYAGWYSTRLKDNAWVGNGSDMQFMGGKTGNTDEANSCFATVAIDTKTNKQYVCVTMDAPLNLDSTNDNRIIYRNYAEGK